MPKTPWKDKRVIDCNYIIFSFILIYIMILSNFSIQKHRQYCSFAWDLGIFNQAFWTTNNHIGIFRDNCELFLVDSGSFFGVHFSPILYSLIPFYTLSENPETLLIAQSSVLGLAALPLFLITKNRINVKAGLLVSSLYLCNPMIHGVNAYDFHVQCYIPLLIFSNIFYALKRRWKMHLITTILSFMIEEHLFYILVILPGVIYFENDGSDEKDNGEDKFREISYLLFILTYGLFWFTLSNEFIRLFNPEASAFLRAGRHYRILGIDDPIKIPLQILSRPFSALTALQYSLVEKLWYLLQLFGPFLFIPFLSPFSAAPMLPWFAVSLLSNYQPYYSIGFQYPAYVLPFIFVSFVLGLKKTIKWKEKPKITRLLLKCSLVVNVIYFIFVSPLISNPTNFNNIPAYVKHDSGAHIEVLNNYIEIIPETSSVLTQDNIFPHISSRENAYAFPPPFDDPEDGLNGTIEELLDMNPDYIIIDQMLDRHKQFPQLLESIEKRQYQTLEAFDGIILFKHHSLFISETREIDVSRYSRTPTIVFQVGHDGG